MRASTTEARGGGAEGGQAVGAAAHGGEGGGQVDAGGAGCAVTVRRVGARAVCFPSGDLVQYTIWLIYL